MPTQPTEITSLQNQIVKQTRALRKRREREQTGYTVVEGITELRRALEAGVRIVRLLGCRETIATRGTEAIWDSTPKGVERIWVAKHVFEKLAYREESAGLIAVVQTPSPSLEEIPLSGTPMFLIAEAIEKPGNLGAMLRSADAAGANGLLACDAITDIYNPNTIRASLGTVFSIAAVLTGNQKAYDWLHRCGTQIVAATPDAERTYSEVDLAGPLALAVGNEYQGLSEFWRERADLCVRIPMHGRADSLNAAMAVTVLLFEAARQRGSIELDSYLSSDTPISLKILNYLSR